MYNMHKREKGKKIREKTFFKKSESCREKHITQFNKIVIRM